MAPLALGTGDVHVWIAEGCDPRSPRDLSVARAVLSTDERDRADRMRPGPRHQFIAARAVWRTILGRYLGRPPAAVQFRYGPEGAPLVDAGETVGDLRTSLSHSGPLVAVACARVAVGIDVERPLAADRVADIVRYLAPLERVAIDGEPPVDRGDAFLRCWTRKEAFAKALGLGLSLPFDAFEVSIGSEARLLASAVPGEPPAAWRLWTTAAGRGAILSVAARGTGLRLQTRFEPSLEQALSL